jgi:hypothetical protein
MADDDVLAFGLRAAVMVANAPEPNVDEGEGITTDLEAQMRAMA